MTTQDLYTKVVTGEITEQKFLYEVRRDINLPFITPSNNFKDTVKILKNKGMISEKQTKLSTGKQEVDIIAKTIDMVNPYEYARGMDDELGILTNPVNSEDVTEDKVLKAQKKVLKNLTKNPSYYTQRMSTTMPGGKDNEMKEVTPKEISKIQKDAKKNNKKYIREHGEDAERVADVNADSTPLEEKDFKKGLGDDQTTNLYTQGVEEPDKYEVEKLGETRDAIYEKYAKKYGVDVDELKDRVEARKMETEDVNIKATDPKASEKAAAITKSNPDTTVNIG